MDKVKSFFLNVKEKFDALNPIFIIVILSILFFFPTIPIYDRGTTSGDTSEYLNNPVRILNGELPYKDFWLLHPPGEVYLPALMYKLFGLNINII